MSQSILREEPEGCDLLVVGGGATGLGVALQAALEGRSVVLVEARDFASGTSSRSAVEAGAPSGLGRDAISVCG